MSKAFRLGDYLKPEETAVPKLNTERIEYLSLDLIDPDPDNFYSLEGIADLAENIELVGLLDPIRVRPALSVGSADSSPSRGAKGRYIVVSGHRRRAACMMIRDGGNPMFDKGVASIVERGGADDEWRRLRLIFANSHTRVLSPAEISRQADEVLKLLTKLKASGVELPGRMREHVAEALNVSSSKLGRVQAIRRNLVPELLAMYDAGKINEAVAYRISQEDAEMQGKILADQGEVLQHLTADGIAAYVAHRRFMDDHRHDAADATAYAALVMAETEKNTSSGPAGHLPLEGKADGGPPRASAPTGETESMEDFQKRQKAETDAFWGVISEAADSIIPRLWGGGGRWRFGPSRHDNAERMRSQLCMTGATYASLRWDGDRASGITVESDVRGIPKIRRTWLESYDLLAAAALNHYMSEFWCKKPLAPSQSAAPTAPPEGEPGFRTGTPPRDGRYFVRIDMGDGGTHEAVGSWRGGSWSVFNGPLFETMKVTGWYPLPEKGGITDGKA